MHALATLKRRMATLPHLHDALSLPNPARAPEVRLLLRGLARVKGARPLNCRIRLRDVTLTPDEEAAVRAEAAEL